MNTFLEQLHSEAAQQAKLEKNRFLPREIDLITSFIANHAFWTILIFSFVCAVGVSVLTRSP